MSSLAAGVLCILAGWEVKKKRKDDCRPGWEERARKFLPRSLEEKRLSMISAGKETMQCL